uniref:Multiprotein bridging factor 1 n=1 Tax=Solanum tuberosum TaxID=4113 RepID=M1BX07_SOLTU
MSICGSKRRTSPIIVNVHHNQVPPHINHPPPRNNLFIIPNQNQPWVPPHINPPPPRNNRVIVPNQNQSRPPKNPVIVVNQNKPFKLRDAILHARNRKNLSQVQLAQKINVKPQKIQEYESGRALPSQVTISKLQNVLGVRLQGK